MTRAAAAFGGTDLWGPGEPWLIWSAGSPGPSVPAPSLALTRRVLVVDDDPEIRSVVQEILEDEGYTVTVAAGGAEALQLLAPPALPGTAGPSFCAILLDMRMPGINGWDVAAAYRALPGPHAPIVTMTAATDAQRWGAEIAAAAVLGKPFDLDQLVRVITAICGSPSPSPSPGPGSN